MSISWFAISAGTIFVATCALVSAQDDPPNIQPLYDRSTLLEPELQTETESALVTTIGDRVRDRHAREQGAYDHYLSWYWEERSVSIEIVDEVAKGGSIITFFVTSLAPLDQPDLRCFFRGINTVAEYHHNVSTKEVSPNRYSTTVTFNPVARRPIEMGDQIEFEFSPFLKSPEHGRANYYGTALLYVVGEGIVPWRGVGELLDSFPIPSSARLGGDTSLSFQYSNEPRQRFNQMAGNISPASVQPFLRGRRIHHTSFHDGQHSEQPNPIDERHVGKSGPNYIATSCVACHENNARSLPTDLEETILTAVIKTGGDEPATSHPIYGATLHPHTTDGSHDTTAWIDDYEFIQGSYADGTSFELRKPVYAFSREAPSRFSVRLSPQLVGMGLLEAIPEDQILAWSDPNDENDDGISGRVQVVRDADTSRERIGRFGYKASQPDLRHQIAHALRNDMGVTTSLFPTVDGQSDEQDEELDDAQLDDLTRYVALLGVGSQRDYDLPEVERGRALFEQANCIGCHIPATTTSDFHPFAELRGQQIQPFTDLLLHDMGPGLADDLEEHRAQGAEWRTAPLWSIGTNLDVRGDEAFLHDGRARTLDEAILWHGGEAEESKEAFRHMPAEDRRALIRFLRSL